VNPRRAEMLLEMGIAPVWRRRGRATEAATVVLPAASPLAVRVAPPAAASESAPQRPDDEHENAVSHMDWTSLRAAVAECTACPLHQKRTQTVFGVGDENADWLLVGEGPGAEEDLQGEPFVGQAGKLLDNMLAAIGLSRGDKVYIANIVKCRPPGNRNPEPIEAHTCQPYLRRQIELIQPRLIIALGKVAAVNLLGREASIAALRGSVHHYGEIPLIVTYHPAYLLRSLPEKAKAWADLCFAVETMRSLQTKDQTPSSH